MKWHIVTIVDTSNGVVLGAGVFSEPRPTFTGHRITYPGPVFGSLDEAWGHLQTSLAFEWLRKLCPVVHRHSFIRDDADRIALDHPGLVEWLAGHDRGLSSNAMVTRMTGIQASNRGRMYPPSDAPDFGRCFRLLEAVPTLRPLLGEMRDVSTTWARLVDGWDGIEHCYRLDLIEWSICDARRVNPPPVARTYIEMNRATGPTASNITEAGHERFLARLELDRGQWERDRPDIVDEALQRAVTP